MVAGITFHDRSTAVKTQLWVILKFKKYTSESWPLRKEWQEENQGVCEANKDPCEFPGSLPGA